MFHIGTLKIDHTGTFKMYHICTLKVDHIGTLKVEDICTPRCRLDIFTTFKMKHIGRYT